MRSRAVVGLVVAALTGCGRLSFDPALVRVAITVPAERSWINAETSRSFHVAGECSGDGELILLTASSATAAATCTGGGWDAALDLSDATDGTVTVTATEGIDENRRTFRKDVVPPGSPGPVLDGSYNASLVDSPSIAWQPAVDAGSGLDHYELAIGLLEIPTSILDWTDVGVLTAVTRTSLSLQEGRQYVVSVRAVDQAGNTSTATSDGFIPDLLSRGGLVGHWTFNPEDISGATVRDVSGNGNDGTLLNGPTLVSSPLGNAAQFDGVDDYVEIPDSVSLRVTSMTVAAWVLFPAAPSAGWRMIFEHARNTTNWIAMVKSINGDWWHWRWQNGAAGSSNDVGTTRPFTVATWVHLTFTVDLSVVPNKVQAYIDGVLDTERIGTDAPAAVAGVSTIGRAAINGGGEYLPGLIDEVRVYDRALVPAEVTRLYNLGR